MFKVIKITNLFIVIIIIMIINIIIGIIIIIIIIILTICIAIIIQNIKKIFFVPHIKMLNLSLNE